MLFECEVSLQGTAWDFVTFMLNSRNVVNN